jgi:LmbE family N-acetylglucosaminyl deacetylase
MTCLYVSPHPDDVALSCGGGLLDRRARGERVVVCSVFTEGPESARRLAEDAALSSSGCDVVHLGFADAPTREAVAPSFRSLVLDARVRPELVESVARALGAVIEELDAGEIWAPLGVGCHVDHLTVFAAARRLPVATRYYEERPYAFVQPLRELRRLQLEGGTAPAELSAPEIARAFERGACAALLEPDEREACCAALAEALARSHAGQGVTTKPRAHRLSLQELTRVAALIECYASQTRWLFGERSVASIWQRLAAAGGGWFEGEVLLESPRRLRSPDYTSKGRGMAQGSLDIDQRTPHKVSRP